MTSPAAPNPQTPGRRVLSDEEKLMVQVLKGAEAQVLELFGAMKGDGSFTVDQRWLAIAATHIEQGFMAAVRAVAKPLPVNAVEAQSQLAGIAARIEKTAAAKRAEEQA